MSVPKAIFTPAFSAFLKETLMFAGAGAVALAVGRACRRPIGVVDAQCGDIPCALLEHLLDGRIIQRKPVLNGIAAAIECGTQPDAPIGVAGDFLLLAVGFIHHRFDFVQGQSRLRNQTTLLVHPGAVCHINFDPIGSVGQLLAA